MRKTYVFNKERYVADTRDPDSYSWLVNAMLKDGCLGGELAGFVNEMYDLPHIVVEDMLYDGAQKTLDKIVRRFVRFVAENFDAVALQYVKEAEA